MRTIILFSFFVSHAFLLEALPPVTASRGGTDNSVFAAEEAMQHQFIRVSESVGKQSFADSPSQITSAGDPDAEAEKANLELRAVSLELNSSNVLLQSQAQSLHTTIALLHAEESRRSAAERTLSAEAVAIKSMRTKISDQALSLTSAKAALAQTSAQLRAARGQLLSATSGNASDADPVVTKLQSELQASRSESRQLKQRLGRVVKMVRADLAAKDREASDALDKEQGETEKAHAEFAARQKEMLNLRAEALDFAAQNSKLRATLQTRQR